MPEPEEFLTIEEVAGILRSGADAVYHMVHTGKLPSFRPTGNRRGKILVRKTDLAAYVEQQLGGQIERPA